MTRATDHRLARRAARGDQRAFEEIYRRYGQDLYRFSLAMVGDPQDAQDALQNTMVKVLRALPGESREIALKPWLFRIARNEAVETMRRRTNHVEAAPEQIASPIEIAETAADRERLRRLLADIRELPERQRGALVMRELSGLGFDEIARALQTSPATARQTVYEARLGLRQMEAGREMQCEAVTKVLSDADGRVAWRRDLRAHLRDCLSCRAFSDAIMERQGEFAAIAPLPLAASAYLLHGVLGGQSSAAAGAGAGGTGAGGAIGSGAAQVAASSVIVKSVAVIATAAAVGTAAADRGGLIDLPLPTGGRQAADTQSRSDGSNASQTGGKAARSVAAKAKPTLRHGDRAVSRRSTEGASSPPATAGTRSAPQGEAARPGESAADQPIASHQGSAASRQSSSGSSSTIPADSHGSSHGTSATGQKGPPDGLPEAANHGQETAAAHKPPQANGSPGPGSGKGGPPSGNQGSGAPPSPPTPPEPPGKGGDGPAPPGPPSPPPSHGEPPAGPPPDHGGGPPSDHGGGPPSDHGGGPP
jgi:RNA polymerase sigma factor (sigma-70 family)